MAKLSRGKYAQAISDRSGMAFPYQEMLTEWDGSFVHTSEFEAKQPQIQPTRFTGDPQGLSNARPDRTEPATENLLPGDPLSLTSGSPTVTVTEPAHGRSTNDTVVFRNVNGSPGGLVFSLFENTSGFSITVVDTNSYSFNCGSNATVTEKSGGMFVTAGPVTLTP
tara:strand:+ start:304 stop:801 length:498 start_codon:yes stop_codon:yes gene_type:complete